jgi:hypothetical protein
MFLVGLAFLELLVDISNHIVVSLATVHIFIGFCYHPEVQKGTRQERK